MDDFGLALNARIRRPAQSRQRCLCEFAGKSLRCYMPVAGLTQIPTLAFRLAPAHSRAGTAPSSATGTRVPRLVAGLSGTFGTGILHSTPRDACSKAPIGHGHLAYVLFECAAPHDWHLLQICRSVGGTFDSANSVLYSTGFSVRCAASVSCGLSDGQRNLSVALRNSALVSSDPCTAPRASSSSFRA
jgi:hypothetical protein